MDHQKTVTLLALENAGICIPHFHVPIDGSSKPYSGLSMSLSDGTTMFHPPSFWTPKLALMDLGLLQPVPAQRLEFMSSRRSLTNLAKSLYQSRLPSLTDLPAAYRLS